MTELRLLQDIRNQPESLQRVLDHHSNQGRAALLDASARIRGASKVVITGMGASFNAAVPLQYALAEAGINAFLVETAELLHFQQPLCQDAVVLIISRSGESIEAVKLHAALDAAKIPAIALTNDPESTLAREASLHLHMASLADEIVAIQSYTGTVLALYLLSAEILGRFHLGASTVYRALADLPNLIRFHEEASESWMDFLSPNALVYTLGRGPSTGSAYEAALLFGETAKSPAIGLAAATFRHGPVEVVEQGYRAVIFAPSGRTRALNLAMARELTKLGGDVRIVGPAEGRSELQFWKTPVYPEDLAPLFEVIPLQFATMRTAAAKGIRPGTFRNTGQVTRDEVAF